MKTESASSVVQENVRRRLAENLARGAQPGNLTELAKAMGSSLANVSGLLKKPSMNLTTVERLARALGVPAWEIVKPADAPGGHSLEDCYRAIGLVIAEIPRLRELAEKWAAHVAAESQKKKSRSEKEGA